MRITSFPQIDSATAYSRIKQYLNCTPVVFDNETGAWWKQENLQHTGSFKFRGALSKLSVLPERSKVVTASTGNHALGVVAAAQLFGHGVEIFLPDTASDLKMEKLMKAGAKLNLVKGNSLDAEIAAKEYAREHHLTWVSPYNDPEIISGQGTIAVELKEQIKDLDTVYVTIGGGGLVSGIGCYLKSINPDLRVIGCQPENSAEMYLSLLKGKVVDDPNALHTLSDGSAGPLEEDSITFPICQAIVDRIILVDELRIAEALRHAYLTHGIIIEGAAGVAIAAATSDNQREGKNAAVILCGGNIDPVVHKQILSNTYF